jgi:hypothetical protein
MEQNKKPTKIQELIESGASSEEILSKVKVSEAKEESYDYSDMKEAMGKMAKKAKYYDDHKNEKLNGGGYMDGAMKEMKKMYESGKK